MSDKLVSLLKSLLSDMGSSDEKLFNLAATTLKDDATIKILMEAGCPKKIIEAMRETLELSRPARVYCCKVILSKVKKIPAMRGNIKFFISSWGYEVNLIISINETNRR